MTDSPTMPAIPRDKQATGVFSIPLMRTSSIRECAHLSSTRAVASGVTSRGPKPVPPEVKIASQREASSRRVSDISSKSSLTIARSI